MKLEKPWSYQEQFPINFYYKDEKNRIILTEGFLGHNINWITKIRDTDYVLCFSPCFVDKHLLIQELEIFEEYHLDKNKIFFLLGTEKDVELAKSLGINAEYVNHNSFLDERLFPLVERDKYYDAILISRFLQLKRPNLAAKVNNLCVLSPNLGDASKDDFFDLDILKPKFLGINIEQKHVLNFIRESHCGLYLSQKEGACFSSSETLLCGVPVVSTECEGGREVWYNEFNSIICEDNEDSVKESVEKIKNGGFDPFRIRERHILKAIWFRIIFVSLTGQIFREMNVDIDYWKYFSLNFSHKMYQHYHPKDKVFPLL